MEIDRKLTGDTLPTWGLGLASALAGLTGLLALGQYLENETVNLGGLAVFSGEPARLVVWCLIAFGGGLLTWFVLLALCPPSPDRHNFFVRIKTDLSHCPWPLRFDELSEILSAYAAASGASFMIEDHVVIELEGTQCILMAGYDARAILRQDADDSRLGEKSYLFFSPQPIRPERLLPLGDTLRQKHLGPQGGLYEIIDLRNFYDLLGNREGLS